jgi:uncharacterized protein
VKIAVVGTGIAGLSAAWMLSQRHEVTVFEQERRIGGHSNTVDVARADGTGVVPVDTGFIVFNHATYPNLCALFDRLNVPTIASDMSFGVSIDSGRLEYSADGLFAQKRNLLSPTFLLMLRDIVRFYREAPGVLADPSVDGVTLGDWLAARRYGTAFIRDHLLPMGAAIWSAPIGEMMGFPVRSFVRFFKNHGLLQIENRPPWYTVAGGSRAYVTRLTASFADRIRPATPVLGVRRMAHGVEVRTTDTTQIFDEVVLACHSDEALRILDDASDDEIAVLAAVRFQANRAVLHRDVAQMPRRRKAWASWNYLADGVQASGARVAVTYWMNRLQGLDPADPLFVTLNPLNPVDPAKVVTTVDYAHPMFDTAAVEAQGRLQQIQGTDRVWFCGAWCGFGFHEDGLSSGLAVAEALGGVRRPWAIEEVSPAGRNATPRVAVREAA